MRTSAITATVLALSTLTGVAIANDDFSALLADLSFGDAPSLNQPANESLSVVKEETLKELEPVPAGMLMPGMIEAAPAEAPTLAMPTVEEKPEIVDLFADLPEPQVALMDPVPATEPASDSIDMEAAFALQESAATPAKSVGHLRALSHGCETGHCDSGVQCRPRQPVRLPTSSFYQYWNSHPCYTNVWDGYGIYCGCHHKHLHGECDCFKNKGCGTCDNCDSH